MASPRKRRLRKLIRAGRDPRKAAAPAAVEVVPVAVVPVAVVKPRPPVGIAPKIIEPATNKTARKPKNKAKAKE
jgi:hypothetical protein